jgi:hypothetical protein
MFVLVVHCGVLCVLFGLVLELCCILCTALLIAVLLFIFSFGEADEILLNILLLTKQA